MVETSSQKESRIRYRSKPEVKERLLRKSKERYQNIRNDPIKWEKYKERMRKYRHSNKEYFKQKTNEYYEKNGDYLRHKARERTHNLKIETISVYSNGSMKCECCGESELEFLTIDHINNDGGNHRRSIGMNRIAGVNFYAWLKRNGFPLEYQVLCWNCNCGKIRNGGICPHKTLLKLNSRQN